MSPQKRLDMRIQKTIASIRDAFSSLLLEMPFNDITVVLLCERALVNKKTFYRYYPNTLALLIDLQQEYSMPYVELTESLRYPDDLEEIARTFLTYSAEQGELYDRIICNENYAAIQREIVEEMEEPDFCS